MTATTGTKLYPFTFPDSGKRISIRKVSFTLSGELRKTFPPPQPPMVEVTYPAGARMEPNPNDPDYVAALGQYNREFDERLRALIIKRGVYVVLSDDERAELQQLRDDMAEQGVTLPDNDIAVWINNVCISTPEDYKDLVQAITRRTQPTEEASADALERFRAEGQVPNGQSAHIPG